MSFGGFRAPMIQDTGTSIASIRKDLNVTCRLWIAEISVRLGSNIATGESWEVQTIQQVPLTFNSK